MGKKWKKRLIAFFALSGIFLILYFFMGKDQVQEDVLETRAEVLMAENSELISSGVSYIGYQDVKIKIKGNTYKGKILEIKNHMMGKRELDTIVEQGDSVFVGLQVQNKEVLGGVIIEHDRLAETLFLLYFFSLILVLYAGKMGVRALFSFLASIFVLWKVMIPGLLGGMNPLLITMAGIIFLTGFIIFSVSGWNKRSLVACLSSCTGTVLTFFLTQIFGYLLKVSGFTAPYAETLLVNGLFHLNIQELFYAAIVIGASGASMDIAMDVSASLYEIKEKKPEIQRRELMESGFTIGKAVIGTMTTTLLLAYAGTSLTLLMLFSHKDTSLVRMVNLKMISGELMRTVVGSMGLILVAPLTAALGSYVYCHKNKKEEEPLLKIKNVE